MAWKLLSISFKKYIGWKVLTFSYIRTVENEKVFLAVSAEKVGFSNHSKFKYGLKV